MCGEWVCRAQIKFFYRSLTTSNAALQGLKQKRSRFFTVLEHLEFDIFISLQDIVLITLGFFYGLDRVSDMFKKRDYLYKVITQHVNWGEEFLLLYMIEMFWTAVLAKKKLV